MVSVLKTLYLPFVLEKDLRKGYGVVDEEESWGFISLYLYRMVRRKRSVLGDHERISELCAVNYPFLLKCFDEMCCFFDAKKKKQIMDHGISGSLAILSNFSSVAPYLSDSIDLNYTLDTSIVQYNGDYCVPKLRSGEGIYRLTYLYILLKDKYVRTMVLTPICYIPPSGLYNTIVLREYSEFKRVLEEDQSTTLPVTIHTIDKLELYNRIVMKIKKGLEKLVDKRVIDSKEVLKIIWMFE